MEDVTEVPGVWVVWAEWSGSAVLQITAHHVVVAFPDARDDLCLDIPLIALAERLPPEPCPDGHGTVHVLSLYLRTFERLRVGLPDEATALRILEQLRGAACYTCVEEMYAFHAPPSAPAPGWQLYNAAAEYKRQGVGTSSSAWRISTINASHTFSPTYPALLVVPAHVSDQTLTHAAKHRSKARIPVLSYLHATNGASITRSSQPLVGLTQNRSVQDEKLVAAIFATNAGAPRATHVYGATATNLIMDARPATNAMANIAKGAGTENMEYYVDCKKTYLGVDNIHVMRDALTRLTAALRAGDDGTLRGRRAAPDGLALARSQWLKHVGMLLDGTHAIVHNVHVNASHVLVHCSDGWDRTSQLTSLASLCLDPYYRTLHGFAVLVEKEWLSFGHRFRERHGLVGPAAHRFVQTPALRDADGERAADEGAPAAVAAAAFWDFTRHLTTPFQASAATQCAPIFHQFLDCVAQLQRQHPARFEFDTAFLAALLCEAYAGRSGTFLYDSERERTAARGTPSVWDTLLDPARIHRWRNEHYDTSLDDPRQPGADMGVLFPDARDLRFPAYFFACTDAEMNARVDADRDEQQRLRDRLSRVGRRSQAMRGSGGGAEGEEGWGSPRADRVDAAAEAVFSAAQDPGAAHRGRWDGPADTPPTPLDESLQATASRMRSLLSDGWGRMQGAMRRAGERPCEGAVGGPHTHANPWASTRGSHVTPSSACSETADASPAPDAAPDTRAMDPLGVQHM
ncbi:hypothetical protein MSPP1_002396 [Malassezia sp. CBS 17886]|nr:hypothetical protein MSPP1_002396 [Malassezia sp. CBS 17886]